MTIKHIRWVACIGLLAIICLQYVWLVNTYKLTKESIQFRSNEVFRDATMREVFYRMEVYQDSLQKKYKDKDTSIMVRINLDEDYDFFEDGRGDKNVNQWLMSNMQVSMQEIVKRDYKLSVSLSSLDSIYRTGLAAEGLDAEVITCVTDSLGNILRSSRSIQVGDYGLLKTGLQPINYKCTENLQAFIVNPYWVIFQQMTLLLIATVLMMAMIVYCLVYQIRIIMLQAPVALIIILILSYGSGMFLATIGVFFRDIEYLWSVALMLIMYTCAIFYYPSKLLKSGWAWILKFNPLYCTIQIFRSAIFGEPMYAPYVIYAAAFSVVITIIGLVCFKKKQDNFILYI